MRQQAVPQAKVPPAKGFKILTYAQLEEIDAEAEVLSAFARENRCSVAVTLMFNENGMLVGLGSPVQVRRIKPSHA